MLRHSCGFDLANRGHDLRLIQDYLGHLDPKPHNARDEARTRSCWRRPLFGQVQINAPVPLILRLTYVFAIAILLEAVLSYIRVWPPHPRQYRPYDPNSSASHAAY
jgi:hypothetical protein